MPDQGRNNCPLTSLLCYTNQYFTNRFAMVTVHMENKGINVSQAVISHNLELKLLHLECAMLNNLSLKLDFEWCFYPIVFSLRCLGVDLLPSERRMKTSRWLTHIYALIWLISNVGMYTFNRFVSKSNFINNDFTAVYNMSYSVIVMIGYVGSHLILLFFIRPRFAPLMNSFRLLKNQLNKSQRLKELSSKSDGVRSAS